MRKTCSSSCATDRYARRLAVAFTVGAIMTSLSCAVHNAPSHGDHEIPKDRLAFFNDGKILLFGVDIRAARTSGPSEFLPLQVILANHGKQALRIARESFVLERPDGTRLPTCTVSELRRDYHREMADRRLGEMFLDTIAGRFPEPPFHWQSIDFFPPRSGTGAAAPRNDIDLRFGDVVVGYLYFRQPSADLSGVRGMYKLVLTPGGTDTTFVVDLMPYELR
jgi:hypothetical protein